MRPPPSSPLVSWLPFTPPPPSPFSHFGSLVLSLSLLLSLWYRLASSKGTVPTYAADGGRPSSSSSFLSSVDPSVSQSVYRSVRRAHTHALNPPPRKPCAQGRASVVSAIRGASPAASATATSRPLSAPAETRARLDCASDELAPFGSVPDWQSTNQASKLEPARLAARLSVICNVGSINVCCTSIARAAKYSGHFCGLVSRRPGPADQPEQPVGARAPGRHALGAHLDRWRDPWMGGRGLRMGFDPSPRHLPISYP